MNPFQFVADHVRNVIINEADISNLPRVDVVEDGLVSIIDISGINIYYNFLLIYIKKKASKT